MPEYPNPAYIADVVARFPDEPIANAFEARVLLEQGYTWLDIRSKAEYDEGYVPGSVNVPLINAVKRWDSDVGDKVYVQTSNADFVSQVQAKLPDKSAPFDSYATLSMCRQACRDAATVRTRRRA